MKYDHYTYREYMQHMATDVSSLVINAIELLRRGGDDVLDIMFYQPSIELDDIDTYTTSDGDVDTYESYYVVQEHLGRHLNGLGRKVFRTNIGLIYCSPYLGDNVWLDGDVLDAIEALPTRFLKVIETLGGM